MSTRGVCPCSGFFFLSWCTGQDGEGELNKEMRFAVMVTRNPLSRPHSRLLFVERGRTERVGKSTLFAAVIVVVAVMMSKQPGLGGMTDEQGI